MTHKVPVTFALIQKWQAPPTKQSTILEFNKIPSICLIVCQLML